LGYGSFLIYSGQAEYEFFNLGLEIQNRCTGF